MKEMEKKAERERGRVEGRDLEDQKLGDGKV